MKESINMATKTADLDRGQSQAEVTEEISAADRAMGASMIAAGVGSLVLGIGVVLAEVNADIKTFLNWVGPVGPLSGKTGLAVIAFILSWVILHYAFQRRAISLTRSFIVTVALLVLGLLLTFPPVFVSLAG
jgi:cytochrome c1